MSVLANQTLPAGALSGIVSDGHGNRDLLMSVSYRFLPANTAARPALCGVWEMTAPAGGPAQPVAPDGRPELVVHLTGGVARSIAGRAQSGSAAVIAQPISGVLTLNAIGPVHIRALRLQPAGLYRLGCPPESLRDLAAEPDAALGALGAALTDALEAAPTLHHALAAVERLIEGRLAKIAATTVFSATALARLAGAANEAELERLTGWTGRHVRRLLLKEIGHTPAEWRRLAQFHTARALIVDTRISFARIAADAGFHDQAHMIHRVKTLGGATPAALRRDAGDFAALYA